MLTFPAMKSSFGGRFRKIRICGSFYDCTCVGQMTETRVDMTVCKDVDCGG